MRTFAQKPKAAQQTKPAESAKASPMLSGQRCDEHSILQLQRAIGNQRLLGTNAESLEVETSIQGTARFSHDFSRIPVHSGTSGSIQPKLRINAPGDLHEQEAERVADKLLANPTASTAFLLLQRDSRELHGQNAEAQALPSVDRVLAKPGEPLQPALQKEMEGHFRYDLSPVRLHHGPDAEESARDVNAEAYTVGHHIVFGTGRYSPETLQGKRLLIHELTHVLQSRGSNFLQRLIRTPYPWRGVILSVIGANIRSIPDSSDPSNILDSIPQGQIVQVISSSGNWLRVESRYRGSPLVGYIHHKLVDDATSSSMAASVGTTMVWRPSGPGSGTTFESWASAATETPFPAVTSTTVMNCWEAVLLSAFRAGSINWNWIHNLYVSTPTGNWVVTMTKGARHTYAVPGPNPTMPKRGDLVYFNGLAHVALATGNGSDVYTFWPPPNTPFTPGGTTDKVKVFTIEDLVMWWAANMPPPPTVEFAAPAW